MDRGTKRIRKDRPPLSSSSSEWPGLTPSLSPDSDDEVLHDGTDEVPIQSTSPVSITSSSLEDVHSHSPPMVSLRQSSRAFYTSVDPLATSSHLNDFIVNAPIEDFGIMGREVDSMKKEKKESEDDGDVDAGVMKRGLHNNDRMGVLRSLSSHGLHFGGKVDESKRPTAMKSLLHWKRPMITKDDIDIARPSTASLQMVPSTSTPSNPTFITSFTSDLLDELNRDPKTNVDKERTRLRLREINEAHRWESNTEEDNEEGGRLKKGKAEKKKNEREEKKGSLKDGERIVKSKDKGDAIGLLPKTYSDPTFFSSSPSTIFGESPSHPHPHAKLTEWSGHTKGNMMDKNFDPIGTLQKEIEMDRIKNNVIEKHVTIREPTEPHDVVVDISTISPSSPARKAHAAVAALQSSNSADIDIDDLDSTWSMRLTRHDHPIYAKLKLKAEEMGKIRKEREKEESRSFFSKMKEKVGGAFTSLRNRFGHFPSKSSSPSVPPEPSLSELRDVARQLRSQAMSSYDFDRLLKDGETLDMVEAKELFLMIMTKALFGCGLPMHAVEFYVILAGQKMGIHCSLMSIMTSCVIAFGSRSTTHLIQPERPSMSLSKMVDMTAIAELIIRNDSMHRSSLDEIQKVLLRPSKYPSWLFLPSMTLVAFFGAPLFNGGWIECFIGAFGGLFTGFLELYFSDNKSVSRGHDLLSGLFASVVANLFSMFVYNINLLAACFAAIFWTLPGLRAVLAVNDLSTGNPVTGTAKFFSTIMTMLNLGIGVVVGLQLQLINGTEIDLFIQSTSIFPAWVPYLCVLACCPPMMVLLDASPSHWFQLSLGAVAAYVCSTITTQYVGSTFGTWLSSLLVGVMSNGYGRLTPNPAIEMYLFSILMLVPGSIGVKSILADSTLSSVEFFMQMVVIAIAIVTGLFTSNLILPPLRSM